MTKYNKSPMHEGQNNTINIVIADDDDDDDDDDGG